MLDDFFQNLFHPVRFLGELSTRNKSPWSLWVLYGGIAVAGTLLFGFSFGLVHTGTGTAWDWSWVVTLAAGCGWMAFIPVVLLLSAGNNRTLAIHACLMTMVYGEAVLEIGTILNLIGYWMQNVSSHHALIGNISLVAFSNIIMAVAICTQLNALNFSKVRALSLWVVLLNGVGAGVFVILYRGVLNG